MNRVMDESRFRALFDATYPALARYARHRGLDRDDAEDLIASTFEVAWRRLDVVPSDDEALLWLYAVAFNLLRNLRRRQGRDRQLVARLPMVDTVLPSSVPSNIYLLALLVTVFAMLIHMCLGSALACMGIVTPTIIAFTTASGLNPLVPALMVYTAVAMHFVLPFHHMNVLVGAGESGGRYTDADVMKFGIPLTLIVLFITVFVEITWWKIIGLIH